MTEKNDYVHDTRVIRDVADHDMKNTIAGGIAQSRRDFDTARGGASQAFSGNALHHPFFGGFSESILEPGAGAAPFSTISQMWAEASTAIDDGMLTSETRVEEAVYALHQIADKYADTETQNAAVFEGLLRDLNKR